MTEKVYTRICAALGLTILFSLCGALLFGDYVTKICDKLFKNKDNK